MKKIFALIMAALLAVTFAACGKSADYKVGICNYVDDASLNQIAENIQKQLNAIAQKRNVTIDIDYQNANADSSIMEQIIQNFIAEDVDVMIGIATPVAMVMQADTEDTDIPVVFSAVSDPVGCKLVDSLENPGSNITGTSDYLNTEALMNIIFAQNPSASKIGLLYNTSEDASSTPIAEAKEYLDKKGIAYVEKTGSTKDEISLAADSLIAENVDAVFTPTDNTVMTAELAIYEKFADAKIPHFAGANSFALNGAFLGYGVDYVELGVETANTVEEILFNGKKPSDIAVKTFDNGIATVNTDICAALGIEFDDVKALISSYCTKVESITTGENF